MKNIYLIYGEEDYLVRKYKKDIIDSINTDNIIYYNMSENDINDIIIESQTVSLFSSKKLIICENSDFLTSGNSLEEKEVKSLIEYINNPFDDVYIVFIATSSKLDDRKKIVKELKKISKVYEAKKIENYDLNNYINEYVTKKGYKITNKNINLLISIVGISLSNLINELDKIMIYKGNKKEISDDDIKNLATTNIENNIFSLTNSFLKSDKKKTIKIFKDLLSIGIKHEAIIGTISNQLRLLLSVSLMKKNGYSDKEMVSTLKEHPYRIKLAKENNYQIKKLKEKIKELSYLDLKIKSNKVDKTLGLELFLLNI